MNSVPLLVALNAVALATLVVFHFQSATGDDAAQASQTAPHHLQHPQRPQLAVMTADAQSPIHLSQGNQATPASEHWVF